MKKLSITLEEKQLKEIKMIAHGMGHLAEMALDDFDVRDKLKRNIQEQFDKLESVMLEL